MKTKITTMIALGLCMAVSTQAFAQINQKDAQGRRQGQWIKTNKSGKKTMQGTFKDDYPVDTFYYYGSKGNVTIKNFFSDKGTKTFSQFFHENGTLKAAGNYTDKQKTGTWTYYNDKGKKITEENYKDGKKNGLEKIWDNDGKNVVKATNYKNGKREGEYFESLYADGYFTMNYKNDVAEGTYSEYFPDKSLKIKGEFVKGNKEGEWLVYNPSKELVQKLFYKNDNLQHDALILRTDKGNREIDQTNICMLRTTGKQTQVLMTSGEKFQCFNVLDALTNYLDGDRFIRVDAKENVYLNLSCIKDYDIKNNKLFTTVDLGFALVPDKDGAQMLTTLFRKD